ncbi:hybrid sensor histidine kinase/response regulator [Acidipila sp. EB88]|uniref:hybrid sensor histidine kinase/response regulator n=1 Tax=Acidipila sp. EB88 TaxID=2305226 RepID=UPI0013159882|nr:hybrid sensor histidine kinase/response regulator [Acidipila sp. EB88]
MQFDEEIREFLIESNENLTLLDQDIVHLEKAPDDPELVSSAFRTIHTIKGTCGFFGYDNLGAVTHVIENILGQVREGKRTLSPALITLVLEGVDEVKALIRSIEQTGRDTAGLNPSIKERLEREFHEPGAGSNRSDAGARQDQNGFVRGLAEAGQSRQPASNQQPDQDSLRQPVEPSLEFGHDSATEPGAGTPTEWSAAAGSSGVRADDADNRHSVEIEVGAKPLNVSKEAASSKDGTRDALLAESTIRVDVALLNRLINLVGELVLARNQLLQDANLQSPVLQQTCQRLNLITSELQEGVMKTRMQPIGVVWNKLPRVVRDLASQCGKQIHLEMEGANTELDKTIIEAIKDPLTHIVRNSCDHGIEPMATRMAKGKAPRGSLLLRAYHEGGVVNIEISDDGAGIDPGRVKEKAIEKGLIRPEQAAGLSEREAIHLIFQPGFSTASQVTSISGRGVGMDVVKTNIEKIGGSVDVQNRGEGGTTVRIKIPLTLAIIPGLIVTLKGGAESREGHSAWTSEERFVIPQANLLELVRVEAQDVAKRINHVHGTPVLHHRDELLPLVYLDQILNKPDRCGDSEGVNIVVLQAENRRLGVVVDAICDTQEIVVKPLGRQLKSLTCYVGATIMGDGRPALILDVGGLARLAGLSSQGRPAIAEVAKKTAGSGTPQTLLLFSAGAYPRIAVPLSFVDRLEEVACSQIEKAGGMPAVYYREGILPLIAFPGTHTRGLEVDKTTTLQVIVFSSGARRLGLVVDQIIDIVTDPVTMVRPSAASWILGSGILADGIVDLLDLEAVLEAADDHWLAQDERVSRPTPTILLVERPGLARELTQSYLAVAGYRILSASTLDELQAHLEHTEPSAILAAYDLLDTSRDPECGALLEALQLETAPIIVLSGAANPDLALRGIDKHVERGDRAGLLEAIASAPKRSLQQQGGQHVCTR